MAELDLADSRSVRWLLDTPCTVPLRNDHLPDNDCNETFLLGTGRALQCLLDLVLNIGTPSGGAARAW